MKRIFQKNIRSAKGGVNVASDVNIVVAGGGASASSRTAVKISQSRGGSTTNDQADTERKEKE